MIEQQQKILPFSIFSNSTLICFLNILQPLRFLFAFSTFLTIVAVDLDGSLIEISLEKMKTIEQFSLFTIFHNNLQLAQSVSCIIMVLLMLGICPWLTMPLYWWVTSGFYNGYFFGDGGNQADAVYGFYLMLVSFFDHRIFAWKNSGRIILLFQQHNLIKIVIGLVFLLMQIQTSIVYLHAFVAKVSVKEWIDSTAIYYYYSNPALGTDYRVVRGIMNFIFSNAILNIILGWSVLILEYVLSFHIFIRNRSFLRYILILAIFFHFCTALLFGIYTFFFTMSAVLLTTLLPRILQNKTDHVNNLALVKVLHN